MNIFKNNWVITLILFCGIAGSLVTSSAYPFILVCVFAIILNNASCIPIILTTPVIDGFLNLNLETPIPVETFVMILLTPIIIWICLIKHPVLYRKALKIYIAFCLLIVLGTVVAIIQRFYSINLDDVLQRNLINFFRILFCIALTYFFITLKIKGFLQGLKIVLLLAPWLLIVTVVYYLKTGTQIGINAAYLGVEDIKHGEFSAIIVAFSVFVFYNIYNDKSWIKKALNIIAAILTGYFIFQTGSKNGLLGLAFVIVFASYYFFIKGKPLRFAGIVILLVIIVSVVISKAINTPTIERLLLAEKGSGIDINQLTTGRAKFWTAGINAFLSPQGLLGYGSTPLASRWVTGTSAGTSEENVLHNTPLEFALQLGIFGLILYCILVFTISKYFLLFWNAIKKYRLQTVVLIPFLCFFSITISGLFLSWQWQSYWWYQTALIFAIVKLFAVHNKNIFDNSNLSALR
jgi:O-antigen ligase